MEQVSSFLENILTVENEDDSNKGVVKPGVKREARKPNSIIIDKLIESLISMIIPVYNEQKIIDDRMKIQKTRPPLSMQIMTNNAIMMNARLTNIFIFFDSVVKIISWENPYFTIGVLLIITHLILKPVLIFVLPLALLINNVLVPHYLILHPPDKSVFANNTLPDEGEPLLEPKIPGPVPEFSQDFLLNFTDLQNHMVLFIYGYDFLIWLTTDYLYFKDEDLSSLVYIIILVLMGANFYLVPLLFTFMVSNYRVIQITMVVVLWIAGLLTYPTYKEPILNFIYTEETRISSLNRINYLENLLISKFMVRIRQDTLLAKEVKPIEVYELQKFNPKTRTWELIGFTNNFYSINHPLRKLNSKLFKDFEVEDGVLEEEDNIKISRVPQIEQVKPPTGFEFLSNKWIIDLHPKVWVEKNLVGDIVNIDDDEKWVYDFYDEESEVFRRRRWTRLCKREVKKLIKN